MKQVDNLIHTMLQETEGVNRREFLAHTGRGLVAATLLGEILSPLSALADDKKSPSTSPDINAHEGEEKVPVGLKQHAHPTEQPEPPPFTPLAPDKRVGFAIVGLGRLALGQILPAFASCKYAKPVALVSGNAAKARKVARQYGIKETNVYDYQNFDHIRDNKEIDVVYIVLPNGMHEEYTVRAAKAGKHILCEKPMANTAAEAKRMIEACESAGKKLMIAYRIQYEPHHRMVQQFIRNKQYGNVKLIESVNVQNMGDPEQWRLNKKLAGGGALPDIGLYCLNTTRFLLGEEPESISATMYSTPNDVRFKEVEEAVLFQMRFPSGVLSTNSCSYAAHKGQRYRCYTDAGGWYGLDPAYPYKGLAMDMAEVKDQKEWKGKPSLEEKDQFALEIDHMADCVLNNKKPYSPGEEGHQDMKLMETIYEAARENKTIILPKITGLDTFRGDKPESEG